MAILNLDDASLRALAAEAILQGISQDQRERLIKAALESLLERKSDGYYGREQTTPIQAAFNAAMRDIARETAEDMLENDPAVKEAIRGLISDAYLQMTTERRATVVASLADALSRALTRED